jgi:hypothetical protein
MGMAYTDLFYFRAFYNTTNPINLAQEMFIQSGYMLIRNPGDTGNATSSDASTITPTNTPSVNRTGDPVRSSNNLSLIIGASVGVLLGILALALLLAAILYHRRQAAKHILIGQVPGRDRSGNTVMKNNPILLENRHPREMLDGHPLVSAVAVRHE